MSNVFRATTDVDYSSFLLRQKTKEVVTSEEDKDEENVNGDLSPNREEYQQTLLNALSKSRGHQQSGVLSFKATTTTTTPSAASECGSIAHMYIMMGVSRFLFGLHRRSRVSIQISQQVWDKANPQIPHCS